MFKHSLRCAKKQSGNLLGVDWRRRRPTIESLEARQLLTGAPTWDGYAENAQHTALSSVAAQSLQDIHWQTPVDQSVASGNTGELLVHYGEPMATAANTIVTPVRTTSGAFQLEAFNGATGAAMWTITTDYTQPPDNGIWPPSFPATLTPTNRLYFAGAGGTVYYVNNPDAPGATVSGQFAFYGLANLASYTSSVSICTPITADAAGNIYFGFIATAGGPLGLSSGFARIAPDGTATYTSAETASGGDATITKPVYNSAPAVSNNGADLYVEVSNTTSGYSGTEGYLAELNATTLTYVNSVKLIDPKSGAPAELPDDGTASPVVGPDGDVYIGVLENPSLENDDRGWLLHFSGSLTTEKTPGAFGWDDTPSIVPASMVPSYTGASSYLLMTKYNDYADFGLAGGVNDIAILDPNATSIDPLTGATVMKPVLTIAGVTPDQEFREQGGQYANAVDEWCINSAVVDPATDSVYAGSEDGNLYRWDLATNSFTQVVNLTAGVGEGYTPTLIGPDGTVYAINDAILFAVGAAPAGAVVTTSGATTATAGAAKAIDAGLTFSDSDASPSLSATVTITPGYQAGDVLAMPAQAGITATYATTATSGVLTISGGTASVSAFQAALRSITLTTSSTLGTRTIVFAVADAHDSLVNGAATKQVNVVAPAEVTAVYVSSSEWSSIFLQDVATAGLGSATYGYLLQTGANQLPDLPWFNIDTITVQFSAPVTVNTSASGLSLYGATANLPTMSTPSNAIDVQSITWKLSNFPGASSGQVGLDDNQYMLALPDTAVTDAQGAPLDGAFTNSTSTKTGGASTTTGQSLPSGTGRAGSADAHGFAGFEFQFNVLPGDANRDYGVNAGDVAQIRLGLAGAYSVYSDIDGDGANAASDVALARVELGTGAVLLPGSAPAYPFAGSSAAPLLVIAPDGSAAMYLAAISGSSAAGPAPGALNASDAVSQGDSLAANDSAVVLGGPPALAAAGSGGNSGTGIASGTHAGETFGSSNVETLPEAASAGVNVAPPVGVNFAASVGAGLAAPSTSISSSLVGIATNQAMAAPLGGTPARGTGSAGVNANVDTVPAADQQFALFALDRSADSTRPAPRKPALRSVQNAAVDQAIQDFEL